MAGSQGSPSGWSVPSGPPTTARWVRNAAIAAVALGLAAALVTAYARARAEAAGRSVDLTVDYDDVREVALGTPDTPTGLLRRLREAGATSVALGEESLGQLVAMDALVLRRGPAAGKPASWDSPVEWTLTGPVELVERVQRNLEARAGRSREQITRLPSQRDLDSAALGVRSYTPEQLAPLGVGYPPGPLGEIEVAGLRVVARPVVGGNLTQAAITPSLDEAAATGAELLIFTGHAVLGYRGGAERVAEEMAARHLRYGMVEFGKQLGETGLGKAIGRGLVRAHSITAQEMLNTDPFTGVERFSLAVRERNVRALYVHLYTDCPRRDAIAANVDYVGAIARRLKGHGYPMGRASLLPNPGLSPALAALAAIGALGAGVLLLGSIFDLRAGWWVLLLAAAVGGPVAAIGVADMELARKLCALAAACAMPALALLTVRPLPGEAPGLRQALGGALARFTAISGLTLAGGLLTAGCITAPAFIAKTDQFAGVKVAHAVPLLLALAWTLGLTYGEPGAAPGERTLVTLWRGWTVAARGVVRYGHVAVLLAGLAAVVVMLLRSGHEAGVAVSGPEIRFRLLMDRLFGVRPRSKEILFGHPLLVLGLTRLLLRRRTGLWVLVTLGTIGQVSIVNTFCHVHTPVVVSLTRALHGLWLGALVGVALSVVWLALEGRWLRVRTALTGDNDRPPDANDADEAG